MPNPSETMRAMVIKGNALELYSRIVPVAREGELLIKVHFAGINRADLFQVAGSYPPPDDAPADIPGMEVSGTVVAVGEGVQGWKVGDEVCALISGGGYAEYALAPASQCVHIPKGLTMKEAASLPEVWATAWMALIEGANLQKGESVLIHGGSSGVGTAAIQLALWQGASQVFVTVGNQDKMALCASLGATPINYKTQDFVEIITSQSPSNGVDVVIDIVGGDYIQRNLSTLSLNGRMISLAFLQSAQLNLRAGALLLKNLSWQGMTLRHRSAQQKGQIMKALQYHIWPLFAGSTIRPVIDSVVTLEEIPQAHARMDKYLHSGKIVVDMQA